MMIYKNRRGGNGDDDRFAIQKKKKNIVIYNQYLKRENIIFKRRFSAETRGISLRMKKKKKRKEMTEDSVFNWNPQ